MISTFLKACFSCGEDPSKVPEGRLLVFLLSDYFILLFHRGTSTTNHVWDWTNLGTKIQHVLHGMSSWFQKCFGYPSWSLLCYIDSFIICIGHSEISILKMPWYNCVNLQANLNDACPVFASYNLQPVEDHATSTCQLSITSLT